MSPLPWLTPRHTHEQNTHTRTHTANHVGRVRTRQTGITIGCLRQVGSDKSETSCIITFGQSRTTPQRGVESSGRVSAPHGHRFMSRGFLLPARGGQRGVWLWWERGGGCLSVAGHALLEIRTWPFLIELCALEFNPSSEMRHKTVASGYSSFRQSVVRRPPPRALLPALALSRTHSLARCFLRPCRAGRGIA